MGLPKGFKITWLLRGCLLLTEEQCLGHRAWLFRLMYESVPDCGLLFWKFTRFSAIPVLDFLPTKICCVYHDVICQQPSIKIDLMVQWNTMDSHYWDALRLLQGSSGNITLIDLKGHDSQLLAQHRNFMNVLHFKRQLQYSLLWMAFHYKKEIYRSERM